MKKIYADFIFNLKRYFKFIAKLGFKDLFINVLLLLLLLLLAGFAYIPVGLVSSLLRTLISTFLTLNIIVGAIYDWFFAVIAAVCSVTLFAYLFNNRFDFKNGKVVPVEGTHVFKKEDTEVKEVKKPVESENIEVELPKEKEEE